MVRDRLQDNRQPQGAHDRLSGRIQHHDRQREIETCGYHPRTVSIMTAGRIEAPHLSLRA
jgi:hypothetical protein